MRREQERALSIVFELCQMIDWYEDGAQPLPHGRRPPQYLSHMDNDDKTGEATSYEKVNLKVGRNLA